MSLPPSGDRWVGLSAEVLPSDAASAWVVEPRCGAVVMFSGTARDHSEGRADVTRLEYEAYEAHVTPALDAIVDEMRERWPEVGRVVLLHRHGEVPIGASAVLVVVAAPHRDEAFSAARFGIDALKATVPIWKRESWGQGADWGLEPQHIAVAGDLA